MAIEYKVIGRHIREARKQKKMTQEEVAAELQMSPHHFGKMERGDRTINLSRLGELCSLLDVTLEQLVAGAYVPGQDEEPDYIEVENQSDFLDAMEKIASGCSNDVRYTMLQVCKVLAENDKTNRSK